MGASKTYANAKRFYYWPGMFDWICALTADCLACQNIKPKPEHLNEVPLEEWQGSTAPFCAIYIDHKTPLRPRSNRNTHCLLIVDSFSRFLKVYSVTNTGAQATLAAVENWILRFGIPQSIIHDKEQLFLTQTLSTGLRSWELPCDHARPTHRGQTEKWKLKSSLLLVIRDVF